MRTGFLSNTQSSLLMPLFCLFAGCAGGGGGDPGLDRDLQNYWDLASYYNAGNGQTTQVTSRTVVIYFSLGTHIFYNNLAPNPKCHTSGTYTVNKQEITYNTGTVDTFSISGDQLTLTTKVSGPPFNNTPGSYSILKYVASFDASGYTATCN